LGKGQHVGQIQNNQLLNMKTKKRLGIWMDHHTAHLLEFSVEPIESNKIASKFTQEVKGISLSKSENLMHNKEQHQQFDFYKQLGMTIRHFDHVLLYGPTDAHSELHNLLKAEQRFDKIKIDTETTEKMSENQEHAFVNAHFSVR